MRQCAVLAAMALVALASTASAAPIQLIDFGGDYVSVNTPISEGLVDLGDPDGEFMFYASDGSFQCEEYAPANGESDLISSDASTNTDHQICLYWTPGGSYTFDGMAATDNLFVIGNDLIILDNVCAVVENSGTFYRSPVLIADTGVATSPLVVTKDEMDSADWVEFDPTGPVDVGGSTIALADLDAITSVGIYAASSSTNSYLDGLEVYAAPEPATLALLGAGGLVTLLRRRRC